MKSLYLSRVIIKNFRNFKSVDVALGHKQVIIGENNVGKTNFLRAIQLIFDPTLSDEDRYLSETDFFDGLVNPMENKEEIEIKVFISNYKKNKTVLAMLSDATVIVNEEEMLLVTYKYFPITRENGEIEYYFNIYKGNDETRKFTHEDRKYLNIKVIMALRDVEGEMRNSRTSPINKLLKNYRINKKQLNEIAIKLRESGSDVLGLDEIVDLSNNINNRFENILGNSDFTVSLKTIDVDPNRILTSLKILLANRSIGEISLGLSNILYISLVLQLLQDNTVPSFLDSEKYEELIKKEKNEIFESVYEKSENDNYFLKSQIDVQQMIDLYSFMERNNPNCDGVTILAIEEPEAHLHPIFQRLIYKDVIRNNANSVLLTTHSTHITSIAPIKSIVHLHSGHDSGTIVHSTVELNINEDDLQDIERYLDVKRGEIYLGKGVILVEGITEEYLVPRFADLLQRPLDEKGIIVCNINSTNFKPYVQILEKLCIPFVVISDGDFYHTVINDAGDKTRKYHDIYSLPTEYSDYGFLGNENIRKILIDMGSKSEEDIPESLYEQDLLFNKLGYYIGLHTFEVDMMLACSSDTLAKKLICEVYNDISNGGDVQKENFVIELNSGEYWKCLKRIENSGIGKGRFAQRMSVKCCVNHIPNYIENAIEYIYQIVG